MNYFLTFSIKINQNIQVFDLTVQNLDSMLLVIYQCLRSEGDSVAIKTYSTSGKKDMEVKFEMTKEGIVSANPDDQEKLICGALQRLAADSRKEKAK